jgi:hypothetical protein
MAEGKKKLPGEVAKSIERDVPDRVKAKTENLKALDAKARREEILKKELPKRKV